MCRVGQVRSVEYSTPIDTNDCALGQYRVRAWSGSAADAKHAHAPAVFVPDSLRLRDADRLEAPVVIGRNQLSEDLAHDDSEYYTHQTTNY